MNLFTCSVIEDGRRCVIGCFLCFHRQIVDGATPKIKPNRRKLLQCKYARRTASRKPISYIGLSGLHSSRHKKTTCPNVAKLHDTGVDAHIPPHFQKLLRSMMCIEIMCLLTSTDFLVQFECFHVHLQLSVRDTPSQEALLQQQQRSHQYL